MILYIAGGSATTCLIEKEHYDHFKNILQSYFYIREAKKVMNNIGFQRLFIDSGAFSAHMLGTKVKLDEYIKFLQEYKDKITNYANLDVIYNPGETKENQLIMEQAGLSPLPVYHYGENRQYLRDYINSGHNYICLGGMVGVRQGIKDFLDETFHEYPEIKFHGFGVGNYRTIIEYPWYSVDSTCWLNGSKLGEIYFKDFNKYYGEFSQPEIDALAEYYDIDESIKDKIRKELKINYKIRNLCNLLHFNKLEELPNKPYIKLQQSLFDNKEVNYARHN